MKMAQKKLLLLSVLMLFTVTACIPRQSYGAPKKVTIKFWHRVFGDSPEGERKALEYTLKMVKKNLKNINVVAEPITPGVDYRQQYDKALMAGDAPTVWYLIPPVDIPARAENGTIADITGLVDNWKMRKEKKVWNVFDNALKIKGKWYGIPYEGYVAATIYNKETIKAGGGDLKKLPKTWSEFGDMGKQLTSKEKGRFGYILLGMDWNAWAFTAWVWSAGGDMVIGNGDGTYKIGFQEDPGVNAALMWHKMIWEYRMTQTNVLESWADVQQDIQSGRGAFGWGDPGRYAEAAESKFGVKRDVFGIIPVPAKDKGGEPAALIGGQTWTFNPKATKAQLNAAFEFVNYVSYNEKFLTGLWKLRNNYGVLGPEIPGRFDLIDKKYALANKWPANWKTEYARVAKVSKAEPSCPHWNDLKNAIAKPLQQICLKENITRDEVKEILTKTANELYAKYPESFKK